MRLHLLLPKVDPKAIPVPLECAYADCTSKQVRFHQPVKKALRDTVHQQVEVHRYRCLKCGRTFRVYPPGVSHAQSSDRVKGLAVLLYLLGLSYGAVSLALESLGVPLSKTEVYETVQAVAARVPGLKREQVFQGVKTTALGGDLTSVKCAGQWLHLGLTVDSLSGLALTIDAVAAEDAQTLKAWIEPIAASVGAQVLVSDDADGFKTTADELGRLPSGVQKSCQAHYRSAHRRLASLVSPG
jgi:transposase-like protein